MQSNASQEKASNKNIIFGILLLAYSLLMLLLIPKWTTPTAYIDYPCGVGHDPSLGISDKTQIAYCISYIPKETISGAGIYAYGSSINKKLEAHETTKNQIQKRWQKTMSWWDWQKDWPWWHGKLTLERDDVVNNHMLVINNSINISKDQTYSYWRATITTNPWLLLVANFRISNLGLGEKFEEHPNLLYANGIVLEDWLPSPIGVIIQMLGISMILREMEKPQKFSVLFNRSALKITLSAIIFSIIGWTIVGLTIYNIHKSMLALSIYGLSYKYTFSLILGFAFGLILLQIGFWEQKHLEEKSLLIGTLVKIFTFIFPFLAIMYFAL